MNKASSMEEAITHADFLSELQQDPAFRCAWAVEQSKAFLAANVILLRKKKEFTQEDLAHAAGMRQPRIAEIERGDANPTIETVAKIAHALGSSVDTLFADPDAVGREKSARGQTARITFDPSAFLSGCQKWKGGPAVAHAPGGYAAQAANDNFALSG